MFMCPKMKVRVAAKLKPMTRDEFEGWQKQQMERQADCDACTEVHRLFPPDYFLEG